MGWFTPLNDLWDWVVGKFSEFKEWAEKKGAELWDALVSYVDEKIAGIRSWIQGIIADVAAAAGAAISAIGKKLNEAIDAFKKWVIGWVIGQLKFVMTELAEGVAEGVEEVED